MRRTHRLISSKKPNLLVEIGIPSVCSCIHALSCIRAEDGIAGVLFLVLTPLRFNVWQILIRSKSILSAYLWLCGEIGFFWWLALYPGPEFSELSGSEGRAFVLQIGSGVLICYFIVFRKLRGRYVYNRLSRLTNERNNVSDLQRAEGAFGLWVTFWVVAFGASIYSSLLGITKMGISVQTSAALPFRLSGALEYTRQYAVPILAVVFIEHFVRKSQNKMVIGTAIVLVAFGAHEAYIKISRGVFFLNLLPLFFWLAYTNRFGKKAVAFSSLILCSGIVVYPLITGARDLLASGESSLKDTYTEMIKDSGASKYVRMDLDAAAYELLNRTFPDGRALAKFFDHFRTRFEGQWSIVAPWGTVSNYHTYVIDGVSLGAAHTSGSTFYTDAYVFAGTIGILLAAFAYACVASKIDGNPWKSQADTKAIRSGLAYVFAGTLIGGLISNIILTTPLVILALAAVFAIAKLLVKTLSRSQ
jgi:hypothetical protein